MVVKPVHSSLSPNTPIFLQMASAVALLSPVMTITLIPASLHCLMDSFTSCLGGSNIPTTPTNVISVYKEKQEKTFTDNCKGRLSHIPHIGQSSWDLPNSFLLVGQAGPQWLTQGNVKYQTLQRQGQNYHDKIE